MEKFVPFFEKYSPQSFDDLPESKVKEFFNIMSQKKEIPNIFLYGPTSSGKYSHLIVLLKTLFKNPLNSTVRAIDIETGGFINIPGEGVTKKNQKAIFALTSNYHIEIDMNQSNAEKCIIPFLTSISRTRNTFNDCHRYIILRHTDRIPNKIQCSLRRICEVSLPHMRLLVTAKSRSSFIDPLQSRFLCLNFPAVTEKVASEILENVLKEEKINADKKEIIKNSRYGLSNHINLSDMLMITQITAINKNIYIPERKRVAMNLFETMISGDRSKIREQLENIYISMSPDFKLILTEELIKLLPYHPKIIKTASYWNHILSNDTLFYPLLPAEAFLFEICDLLEY